MQDIMDDSWVGKQFEINQDEDGNATIKAAGKGFTEKN